MIEQAEATPPTQEHPYPQAIVPYPHQASNGDAYPPPGPPGAYTPPFFAYPPPPDDSPPEGGQNGIPQPPHTTTLPPGVVYVYPPPHPQVQAQAHTALLASASASSTLLRPKRKQVKTACTNCAGACKRCDESRPCLRCFKYGITDTCIDVQRKERKKGFKRKPYKRKGKGDPDGGNINSELPNGIPPSILTTATSIHAATEYAPEGYYPVYYPPPGFMPLAPDSQPGLDGSPHANGQPPNLHYLLHSGAYPPFPHYPLMYLPEAPPPSGSHPLQPLSSQAGQAPGAQPEQPQTVKPSNTVSKDDVAPTAERKRVGAAGAGKKRSRTTKTGGKKVKKVKTAVNGVDAVATAPGAQKELEHEMTTHAVAGGGAEQ